MLNDHRDVDYDVELLDSDFFEEDYEVLEDLPITKWLLFILSDKEI